jgi:hypothetical protein
MVSFWLFPFASFSGFCMISEELQLIPLLFSDPQDEFNDGDDPVTSQPNAGQATSNMPVFAMPPPSGTNPFANETSNLNQGGQRTYTPGERY